MSRPHGGITAGAAFLMATSAIGPGFLTQTAFFTAQLGASLGFVILVSTLLDVVAQLTIWRTMVAADRRAPELISAVVPGLGTGVAFLVAFGGVAFNIGNVAGAGLGLQALTGLPAVQGAMLSAALAIGLFLLKDALQAMDRFAQLLGGAMILATLVVAVMAAPPMGEVLLRSVAPNQLNVLAIVTLVGGTVGGYIPYAGGHRLLDAGVRGAEGVAHATRSALLGLGIATVMRVLLFLAAYGVISGGALLDTANPGPAIFTAAMGDVGTRFFGLVMWAAAITSIVGSAYTTVSFLDAVRPAVATRRRTALIAFIGGSALIFATIGRPVPLLVLAGALNGLILPLSLGALLLAARRPDLQDGHPQPMPLIVAAMLVMLVMAALGASALLSALPRLLDA
jgi:Mn2+/Fe2+ NRAMP family transporter